MIQRRRPYTADFEVQKKVYARVREEVFLTINRKQKTNYRLILSHRPVSSQTVQIYCNGHYLFQGAKQDYQIEGQALFIKSSLLGQGDHTLRISYDYLNDI